MTEMDWNRVADELERSAREKQDQANASSATRGGEQVARMMDESADLLRRLAAAIRSGT